jgi:serine/threonine-protein kinase
MARVRSVPRILSDRYRLLRPIGGGGMGKVFEAEILKTGLKVAIKMLNPLMAEETEARIRLVRECELVHDVDHDGLVPIFDIDEDDEGVPFLVMELLKGQDLRDRLDDAGVLGVKDAVWIAWHVADALHAVHEAKVVHRDLKPENVFLQVQRHVPTRVRLLDFGIAKARETLNDNFRLTRDGRALGTPQYMSPEQASGDHHIDRRTDVYSLGVVLYEMLTGQSPYPGGDDASPVLMLQIIREREPILLRHLRPDASRSLEKLLAQVLAKNRAERLPTMVEVMDHLSRIAQEPLPGAPVTDLDWNDERPARTSERPARPTAARGARKSTAGVRRRKTTR